MAKKSIEKINFAFNIVTLLAAIVGIFIALSANKKAEEANRLSIEANQIARESNQLTITSLNADVEVKETKWSPTLYTCVSPLTGTYLTFNRMVNDILVTNSGGNTTSLVSANGFFLENQNWNTIAYTDNSFSEQIELPADIPPGSSRRFVIASFDLISSGKSLDNMSVSDAVSYPVFHWEIEFGNGQKLKTETEVRIYMPPYISPEEKCVLTNKFYP